jgi:hypothetical protein
MELEIMMNEISQVQKLNIACFSLIWEPGSKMMVVMMIIIIIYMNVKGECTEEDQ